MDMRRILITGGAGFVGSSLALHFRTKYAGVDVVCLDNLYRTGSELNVPRLQAAGAKFVQGDVRDARAFDVGEFDLAIDAAAEPSVLAGSRPTDDVRYVVDTNLVGTLNLLEAARLREARVVFLSTSRVYPVAQLRSIFLEEAPTRLRIAPGQNLPGVGPAGISELFPVGGPKTLYGATKYASEVMVQEYAAQFDLRAVINRCGVLAGPWQMGRVDQGVVALWVAAHAYGLPLKYIGYGGRQVRDALHVADLAALIEAQMSNPDALDGTVYAVGGGTEVSFSLRELTTLCEAATGRRIEIEEEARVRLGDIPVYVTDSAQARTRFGWRPRRSMQRIVDDIAEWIRQNETTLRRVFCR